MSKMVVLLSPDIKSSIKNSEGLEVVKDSFILLDNQDLENPSTESILKELLDKFPEIKKAMETKSLKPRLLRGSVEWVVSI